MWLPDGLSDEEEENILSDWEKYLSLKESDLDAATEFMLSVENDHSFCCIFSRTKANYDDPGVWMKDILNHDGSEDERFQRFKERVLLSSRNGYLTPSFDREGERSRHSNN